MAPAPRAASPPPVSATTAASRRASSTPPCRVTATTAASASTALSRASAASRPERVTPQLLGSEPAADQPQRRGEVHQARRHPHDQTGELLILEAREAADRERVEQCRIPEAARHHQERAEQAGVERGAEQR